MMNKTKNPENAMVISILNKRMGGGKPQMGMSKPKMSLENLPPMELKVGDEIMTDPQQIMEYISNLSSMGEQEEEMEIEE